MSYLRFGIFPELRKIRPGTDHGSRTDALVAIYRVLSGRRVPTLVLHGNDDPLVTVTGGRATADRVPGALRVTYPGMGHVLPNELWSDIGTSIRTNADRAAGRPI